ncbi:MAG: hypothetical protein AABY84_03015, partial [Candidatus Firestonebacteria bacterium]
MKKGTYLYKLIFIPFDIVGIILSVYLTLKLRVFLNPFFTIQLSFNEAQHLIPPATIVVIIWMILFYQTGRHELTAKISTINLS